MDSLAGLCGCAHSNAAKYYFDAIYTVKQPLKSPNQCLMYYRITEISAHAEFSRCRQNW